MAVERSADPAGRDLHHSLGRTAPEMAVERRAVQGAGAQRERGLGRTAPEMAVEPADPEPRRIKKLASRANSPRDGGRARIRAPAPRVRRHVSGEQPPRWQWSGRVRSRSPVASGVSGEQPPRWQWSHASAEAAMWLSRVSGEQPPRWQWSSTKTIWYRVPRPTSRVNSPRDGSGASSSPL